MAVRITDMKGNEKGTSYSNQEVGRMTKRTSKVGGSVLRKTSGTDKAIKLSGQKPNAKTRNQLIASVKSGGGGFTKLTGKKRGGGKRSTTP